MVRWVLALFLKFTVGELRDRIAAIFVTGASEVECRPLHDRAAILSFLHLVFFAMPIRMTIGLKFCMFMLPAILRQAGRITFPRIKFPLTNQIAWFITLWFVNRRAILLKSHLEINSKATPAWCLQVARLWRLWHYHWPIRLHQLQYCDSSTLERK